MHPLFLRSWTIKKLLYLLTALFAMFVFSRLVQNAASTEPSFCELANQLRSGQSVASAVHVIGKPDSIYQTNALRTDGEVTVYLYKQHPLSSSDVEMLIRDNKILGMIGCRDAK
jgi:hypothetical protein